MNFNILYRGELSSCNYDCPYCPFAKHWESPQELDADQRHLDRFCTWVEQSEIGSLGIFFTPWGEALVRRWYQEAIVRLSRVPHVNKVAIQTNLSSRLNWLAEADRLKVALWCTFHPGQTTVASFLRQCAHLDELGVRYSVGCVGLREHIEAIEELRSRLSPEVYVWVNADENLVDYYDNQLVEKFTSIDPHFPTNNTHHPSLGQACRTGQTVFSVDGQGNIRRCHFVKQIIGNIYDPDFLSVLKPRPCPNMTCSCHIGYVHLERLNLDQIYGQGILERIPAEWSNRK
jgi:MoaA/NifB/PqqE/SkfB family radical SAM enzyme